MKKFKKNVKMNVYINLTEDEVKDRTDKLMIKMHEKDTVQEEKKSMSKVYDHRIKNLEGDIGLLRTAIHSKKEYRTDVDCVCVYDFKEEVKRIYLAKDNTLISTEPFTKEDKQMSFEHKETETKDDEIF